MKDLGKTSYNKIRYNISLEEISSNQENFIEKMLRNLYFDSKPLVHLMILTRVKEKWRRAYISINILGNDRLVFST